MYPKPNPSHYYEFILIFKFSIDYHQFLVNLLEMKLLILYYLL